MKSGRGRIAIVLALWTLLVAGSVALLPRVRVENPPDQWSAEPPLPEQRLWRFAKAQFGNRDLLLVGLRQMNGPHPQLLAAAETLGVWLASQPEVVSVFGPREARQIVRQLPLFGASGEHVQSLRSAVLSDDRTVTLLYVSLRQSTGPQAFRSKASFVSRTRAMARARLPANTRVLLAGQPAVNVALHELIRRDSFSAAPLALAGMLAVLSLAAGLSSLGPLLAVLASLLVLLGGFGLTGVPLSAATIVVLPITAVVGLSYGMYVIAAFARTRDRGAAMREAAVPLLWAYATTVVAILSFASAPVPALRVFAVATAAGVTLAAGAVVTLLPILPTQRRRERLSRTARTLGWFGFRTYAWSARRAGWTAIAWIALTVVGCAGLARLRFEPNNFLSFFPRNHEILAAHGELDRSFGGSIPVEVLTRASTPDAERNPAVRDRLRRFVEGARSLQRIGPAFLPPGEVASRLAPDASARLAPWFRARDPHYTRAVFSIPVLPTERARVLFRSLDSLAVELSGPDLRIRVTGVLPSSIGLLDTLVSIEVANIAGLLAVMLVALSIIARGLRAGALLLIPNAIPLLAVGGAMGALGVALDFTTITILSMLLGIAMDNTIHLRWSVRREPLRGGRVPVPRAVRHVATAATLTAVTTVTGFGILVLSPFPASQRLGLFMAIGLATAWLADLTLTPMLVRLEQRTRRDTPRAHGRNAAA